LLGAVIFTLMAAYQWAGSLGLLNAGQNGQVRALSTALAIFLWLVWFLVRTSCHRRNVKYGIIEQRQVNRRRQRRPPQAASRQRVVIDSFARDPVFEVTPINASKPEIEVKPSMPRLADRRYREWPPLALAGLSADAKAKLT
jgi:hypothetical protein